jgi:hypothetical protein
LIFLVFSISANTFGEQSTGAAANGQPTTRVAEPVDENSSIDELAATNPLLIKRQKKFKVINPNILI